MWATVLVTVAAGVFFWRGCTPGTGFSDHAETPEEPPGGTLPPFIHPVSEALDLPFKEYTVTAGRDTLLIAGSGSRIFVPACAFAQSGSALTEGNVTLRYREFHSRADLVAAGIPMTMAGDSREFLETTGMMELLAFRENEPLEVGGNCPLKIELVNTEAGERVNLYFLDQEDRAWKEKKKELPAKIYKPASATSVKKVKQVDESRYRQQALKEGYFMPVKPRVAKPGRYSFHFKINLQAYPELNVYDGILWEYAGTPGGKEDPAANTWAQTTSWKEMKLDKTSAEGIYRLTLLAAGKTFSTVVRPVFEKEDMEYARDVFNDRYKKYREYIDKKNAEEEAWKTREAKRIRKEEQVNMITRSFEINRFGIWNCDRYYNVPDPLVVTLTFETVPGLAIDRVYIVEKNINSVLQERAGKEPVKLTLRKGGEYEFLLLDNEAKFHKISKNTFDALLEQGTNLRVPVKSEGLEMASVNDLKKWL